MTTHLESAQDLAVLIGARQADIMRLLWTRGPASVREIHTQLTATTPLAFTTVLTLCVKLMEKGVLERQKGTERSQPRARKAFIYAPRQSEAEFVRAAIERRIAPVLAQYSALVQEQVAGTPPPARTGSSDRAQVEHVLTYVATLRDAQGQSADTAALTTIAALLERAERAERAVVDKDGDVRHAEDRAAAAERRAERAERRAKWIEQQLAAAHRQLNRPPKQERKKPVFSDSFEEYRTETGICRVCGHPAPLPVVTRQDELRVCGEKSCRMEARRRDSTAKQRRYNERQRLLKGQGETASA